MDRVLKTIPASKFIFFFSVFAVFMALRPAFAEGRSSWFSNEAYFKDDVRLVIGAQYGVRNFSLLNLSAEQKQVTVYLGRDFEQGAKDQSIYRAYDLAPHAASDLILVVDLPEQPQFVSAWDMGLAPGAEVEEIRTILAEDGAALDRDAQPFSRIPPRYPERCMRKADHSETVHVKFNVSEVGLTQDHEVLESSNECFNDVAIGSVEQWVYLPKFVDGAFHERKGVETTITFKLEK